MTLLSPSQAPAVHIEVLPANAVAVKVEAGYENNPRIPSLTITAWSPSRGYLSAEISEDNFTDEYCDRCDYYCESLTFNCSGEELETGEGTLTVMGDVEFYSPCPCYSDGLSSVSFPCLKDYSPSESNDSLSGEYMTYAINYDCLMSGLSCVDTYAYQQAVDVVEGKVVVGEQRRAINTFDPNYDICWGGNDAPNRLLSTESAFTASPCNEDLLSINDHEYNSDRCASDYLEDEEPEALPLPVKTERGKAVVAAIATLQTSAYLLLASSGAKQNGLVAYVTVEHYSNVALDEDTVMNVWATDVMPCGKRLLFIQDENEAYNGQLLGQVTPEFSLDKCESTKQPSLV